MLKKFVLSEEGHFSLTKPYESIQIVRIIKQFINKEDNLSDMVITDGTACVGGDLVRLSNNCKKINGVELSKENYDCLVKNCNIFECENVELFNDDYTKIYEQLKQDIIYLDPPWGGSEYKKKESVELKIGNIKLCDFIKVIKNVSRYIFLKVPMNACLNNIEYEQESIIYNKQKDKSFKLICIRN
jgi:16S rRNA G966 N2-methylase RsmD